MNMNFLPMFFNIQESTTEIIEEMKQLYEIGVRGFWFTDAQFIPSKKNIQDAKLLLQAIKDQGWNDIKWAAVSYTHLTLPTKA